MTTRTALLVLVTLAAFACSPKRIPGTEIVDNADTRAVYDVVQAYRKAMENRDAPAVLALVAPTYFDTAGTPSPLDDLDRAGLEAALTKDFARAEGLKLDLTVRKIEVTGDDAQAEVFYDEYFRVQTPSGTVPRRDSDVHRMKLHKIDGAWKIVSGL
jgi:ketosteroid isomerase-like protein